MAEIIDIEKISEIGKIDIPNLKLILRELLNDIKAEQEQSEDFKTDISVILKLLFEKGLISKEEFESLKDKVNSLINKDKLDDAYDDNLSDDVIVEIIKNSRFKGFFPSYEALINEHPAFKATHGDYAYIKDFDAGTYDVNNIEEYIFDIKFNKWISASDTTHLRNVYIREDEEDTGRLNGQPLDNDLLQYNEALKRWICRTWEEADVARKSALDFHTGNQIRLAVDEIGMTDGSIKDNGRLIVELDTSTTNYEPMHLNKNTFKELLDEIDKDYYTRLHIGTETDELGVTKITILEDDNDQYGNAIRRNVTNEVMRTIINDMYEKLLDTFDIKSDPVSNRILKIDEKEPSKYVPHGINTYNVDKIISAIDRDYNNAFRLSDKEESNYVTILKRVLEGYTELNIDENNVQDIIGRLTKLYENKNLWDRYTKILEHEKYKNMSPEVFNDLIDLINYLYISKDLIRDEILERDIVLNGKKKFTGDVTFTAENFSVTNPLCTMLINAGLINFDNEQGVILCNHQYINIVNPNSTIDIQSKSINIKNVDGEFNVTPNTQFDQNVVVKGNLTVEGTTTTINSTDLVVEDNIIRLNKGETGSGVSRYGSGIVIDRGTSDDLFVGFDETRDKLVTGLIKDETPESLAKLNEIAVLDKNLTIEKPLVYNPATSLLENADLIDTDINGATTFVVNVPNNTFKVLDPVYFEGETLKLCSLTTYERCEVVGIVGAVNGSKVKVVVTGFLPCEMPDIPLGKVLFLLDGSIGLQSKGLIIQRKVGIRVPNGMIVDIQKNSGWESTEVTREVQMHRVLEPGTQLVVPDSDVQIEHNAKIFIDGILQIEELNYRLDRQSNTIVILTPYDDKVDFLLVMGLEWANDGNQYVTNGEVDDMFTGALDPPRPPFENTEYVQDYEVDRMFGVISSVPDENNIVDPHHVDWCTDDEVNNIFSARALYSKYNLLEQAITKDIFVDGNYIYYFSDSRYLDELDFVEIDNTGKFNKINFETKNVIGMIQQITEFENGLIEYQINTSKLIPYSEVPLEKYINRYEFDINYGDKLYVSDKINKFSGNLLCSFSNLAMFVEYQKQPEVSPVPAMIKQVNNYTFYPDRYYLIDTPKMSITTLDLFETDSPNYSKVNLINNTYINEKNLFYEVQLGKKMFTMYRRDDKYILQPARKVTCSTELTIVETNDFNIIQI